MNEEITALMHRHLDGMLTPEEAARLAEALEDPRLAEEFAALTRLDGDLSAAMKEGERTALYRRRLERELDEDDDEPVKKKWPVKSIAAVATFAVLMGAGLPLLNSLDPRAAGSGSNTTRSRTSGTLVPAGSPAAESAALRRELHRFYLPVMMMRSQPVSQTLATLESRWKNTRGENAKAVSFTVAPELRERWEKAGSEPSVALEIPGASLLANLELLAAQAGLKPVISENAVTLEEDATAAEEKTRTWTLPVPAPVLASFINKASASNAAAKESFVNNNLHMSFSLTDAMRAMDLSWLDNQVVLWQSASGYTRIQGPIWMDLTSTNPPPAGSGIETLSLDIDPSLLREDLATADTETDSYANGEESEGKPPAPEENPGPVAETDIKSLRAEAGKYDPGKTPSVSDRYLQGYLAMNEGDKKREKRDFTGALAGYRKAQEVFEAVHQSDPSWNVEILDFRRRKIVDSIEEARNLETGRRLIQGKPLPAAQDPGYVAPSLEDLLATYPVLQEILAEKVTGPFTRLLAGHGMPAEGISYDGTNGVLTVQGTLKNVRAASAAVAAIQESSSDGLAAGIKVIEWNDSPPAGETGKWLTPDEVQALLKLPNAGITNSPRVSAPMAEPCVLKVSPRRPVKRGETPPPASLVEIQVTITGSRPADGDNVNARMSVTVTGTTAPAVADSYTLPPGGGWVRFDLPGTSGQKPLTALIQMLPPAN